MKKRIIIYTLTIILSILFIYGGNRLTSEGLNLFSPDSYRYVGAKVIEVTDTERGNALDGAAGDVSVTFRAMLTGGEQKGELVTATQQISEMMGSTVREVKAGDRVILSCNEFDGYSQWFFAEYIRSNAILVLTGLFVLVLIVMGRSKGVNTVISLSLTCASIFMILIPAILSGRNIYLWTCIICAYIAFMTLLLVNGANKKSLAAALGCICGVFVSWASARAADIFLRLTGMIDENSIYLLTLKGTNGAQIDLVAIAYASILIGAIGAVMDVAVEMSSSLWEIREKAPAISRRELFASGMTIGRDSMGTMSNTLILAYIGGSLTCVLLFVANSSSLLYLFNLETVIFEILQAIAGSLGILFSIPFTSFICSLLYCGGIRSKKTPEAPRGQRRIGI